MAIGPQTSGTKRPHEVEDQVHPEASPLKRGRLVAPEIPLVKEFSIVTVAQDDLATRNVIWMTSSDIDSLFSSKSETAAASADSVPQYARIANRIYQIAECTGLADGTIGLNSVQQSDLGTYIDTSEGSHVITLSPASLPVSGAVQFGAITFQLRRINNGAQSSQSSVVMNLQEIRDRFTELFKDQILTQGQNLVASFPWGSVEATVQECHTNRLQQEYSLGFAYLTEMTKLDFTTESAKQLVIVETVYEEEVEQYCFSLSFERVLIRSSDRRFPLRICKKTLEEQIKAQLGGLEIFPGHEIKISHASGLKVVVKFDRAVIGDELVERTSNDLLTAVQYEKGYRLKKDPRFFYTVPTEKIQLTSETLNSAGYAQFKVVSLIGNQPGTVVNTDNERWIDESELIQYIKRLDRHFLVGERLEVGLSSGRFMIQIMGIQELVRQEIGQHDRIVPVWSFNDRTEIKINVDPELDINLVPSTRAFNLRKIVVCVDLDTIPDDGDFRLTADVIRGIFERCRPEKFVKKHKFFGYAPDGEKLTFKVKKLEFNASFPGLERMQHFGKIFERSVIEILASNYSFLTVVDHVYKDEVEKMVFSITCRKDFSQRVWDRLPIKVNLDELIPAVRTKIDEKGYVFPGQSVEVNHSSGYILEVEFKEGIVRGQRADLTRDNQESRPHHKDGYRIGRDTQVRVKNVKNIIFTTGDPVPADTLVFKLNEIKLNHLKSSSRHLSGNWVCLDELKDALLQSYKIVVEGEESVVNLSSGKYVLKVTRGACGDGDDDMGMRPHRTNWQITEDTEVRLPIDVEKNFFVVRTKVSQPIKKLIVEVSPVEEEVNPLMAMLGAKAPENRVNVTDQELRQLFRENRPEQLVQQLALVLKTERQEQLRMEFKELTFHEGVVSTQDVRVLGEIDDDTIVEFQAKREKPISIDKPIELLEVDDPVKYFENLGLAGIDDQVGQLNRIFYMRDPKLRRQAEKLGVKPVKGALFYGPPGTGKTTFARHLGKILGCSGDRFQKLTSTEILSKWVGENEGNLRKLFQPAIDAQQEFGDESPLYVIVFDEIDAILHKRGSDVNKWGDRLVNQFLGLLDGLEEMNNLLVIGLTNRMDQLDPAVIRPGRLELHIELGIPNATGRRKIFEIHMQKLTENEKLDPSVDIDVLVEQTDGFSGADIEGIVKKAAEFPLGRLSHLGGTEEEIDRSPEGKVNGEDFKRALKEIESSKTEPMNEEVRRMYGMS